MNCPNCNKLLRTIDYEGIHIETCPSCGGEWLDAEELGHVVKAREVRFDSEERRAIAAAARVTGVVLADVDRDLTCPKCFAKTDPVNYGGDTGIIIDKCTGCGGIWVDHNELEKIQMLIEGWEDQLPEDLAKYGPRLRQITREVDERDDVTVSRVGFINAIINGVLDIAF
jgi:Zn-finger nucleic acid-binding protein